MASAAAYRMVTLEFAGGVLRLVHEPLPMGTRGRVRIKSHDVSLALATPAGTNILNVRSSVVTGVTGPDKANHVLVGLHAGRVPLTARIIRPSYDQPGLEAGVCTHRSRKSGSLLESHARGPFPLLPAGRLAGFISPFCNHANSP